MDSYTLQEGGGKYSEDSGGIQHLKTVQWVNTNPFFKAYQSRFIQLGLEGWAVILTLLYS